MVKNLEVKENIPDKRSLFNIKNLKSGIWRLKDLSGQLTPE
jgi:hypothetical protein